MRMREACKAMRGMCWRRLRGMRAMVSLVVAVVDWLPLWALGSGFEVGEDMVGGGGVVVRRAGRLVVDKLVMMNEREKEREKEGERVLFSTEIYFIQRETFHMFGVMTLELEQSFQPRILQECRSLESIRSPTDS